MFINGTIGQDYYNFNYIAIAPYNCAFRPLGEYESLSTDVSETNSMITLNYNSKFFTNLSFTGMLGGNSQRSLYDETRRYIRSRLYHSVFLFLYQPYYSKHSPHL